MAAVEQHPGDGNSSENHISFPPTIFPFPFPSIIKKAAFQSFNTTVHTTFTPSFSTFSSIQPPQSLSHTCISNCQTPLAQLLPLSRSAPDFPTERTRRPLRQETSYKEDEIVEGDMGLDRNGPAMLGSEAGEGIETLVGDGGMEMSKMGDGREARKADGLPEMVLRHAHGPWLADAGGNG